MIKCFTNAGVDEKFNEDEHRQRKQKSYVGAKVIK